MDKRNKKKDGISFCDIVIPVYNQVVYTKACIKSIRKFTQYSYRIIVVDDGSDDATKLYLSKLKQLENIVVLTNEKNMGWLLSANKGMKFSNAPFICLLNNDTLVTLGWLKEMVLVAEQNEDCGIVNPEWRKPAHINIAAYASRLKKYTGRFKETDWTRGFCMLIKHQVFKKIGYFEEAYSPGYFDDHDFSVRAIKAGFRCLRAQASFVWHYRNVTFFNWLKPNSFNKLFERNRRIFYQKWGWPLKILFVNDNLAPDRQKIFNELFLRLARDQNRIYVANNNNFLFSEHDNILPIRRPRWFWDIGILLCVWDNAHRSEPKHYDLIVFMNAKQKIFFERFNFIRTYRIIGLDDLSNLSTDTLKQTANELEQMIVKLKRYT